MILAWVASSTICHPIPLPKKYKTVIYFTKYIFTLIYNKIKEMRFMAKMRYLRLKPTKDSQFSINDSKQLLDYLARLTNYKSKLILQNSVQGISFIMGVNSEYVDLVQNEIQAISPNIVSERIVKSGWAIKKPKTLNLRLTRHYAYPLYNPEKEDALFKLVNQINQTSSKLNLELDISKVSSIKVKVLRKRLISGQSPTLAGPSLKSKSLKIVVATIKTGINVLRIFTTLIENNLNTSSIKSKNNRVFNPRSTILLDKLYEPLFKVNFTVKIGLNKKSELDKLIQSVLINLDSFTNSSGYQGLKISNKPISDIYSSLDLAALFHFNHEDLKSGIYDMSQFKELPLPSYLSNTKSSKGIIIGTNSYSRLNKEVILPSISRQRHLYISGATGSGKSNLLANLIYQDIISGYGITLIDPHGDLSHELRSSIPNTRLKDFIYFDPSDLVNTPSINLLEMKTKPGTLENKLEKDQITESVISLFRKVFSVGEINNHRIEYILRNSIQTSLLIKDSNIFTVFKLLTDPSYRLKVIPHIKDQNLANFWKNELGRAGDYQRVKMSAGITSKIGRYLFSETAKNIFTSNRSSLDFDELLNDQKILICDLSKGKLGEDNTNLIASSVLTKIQLASQRRVLKEKQNRMGHYLYIDEFQTFATTPIIQMLSEARKYGLYLTMAEQSPSQQDIKSTNEILANVGNIATFRTASPKDASLLAPILSNDMSLDKLYNLPSYVYYFKSVSQESVELTTVRTSLFTPLSIVQMTAPKATKHIKSKWFAITPN